MGDPLSLTEYPRSTPPTLPTTAGTVFTDPDFGSEMVRVTVPADGQQHELTISTTGVWNYDATRIGPVINYNYPATGNDWVIYTFNPTTMAVSGKKKINETGMNFGFQYVMWDWSGLRNNYLCGVLSTANDADRNLLTFDTSGTISTAALVVIKPFLTYVQRAGAVVSAATSSSFIGNHTDPEVLDNQWLGLTLTFDTGNCAGQTKAITSYTAATKTFNTAAFSTIPSVGSTYHLNYQGLNHNFEVSPDGRYFVWAACEGVTGRGGAGSGQDAGRTMFWYDRTSDILKVHYVTGAETGQDVPFNAGIHSLELFKDGQKVLFSGMGTITGNANPVFLWDPMATNPRLTTGDGSISVYSQGAHRDESYTRWAQHDWSSGYADTVKLRTVADPATQTTCLSLPLKGGQHVVWTSSGYLSWTNDSDNYFYNSLPISYATSGWSLVSGAKYKSTSYIAAAGLTAAMNPEGRHNGLALTYQGSAAGAAATAALLTAAGQYAWDSTNSAVYVWGFNDADLVNKVTEVTSSVVTDAGNTTTSFKTNLTSAVNDYYKGQILAFNNYMGYAARRITAYNGTTKVVTVDSALHAIPSGVTAAPSEAFVVRAHLIHLWDWRVGANEIQQVWVNEPSNTTKLRRICHMHSFLNAGSGDGPSGSLAGSNFDMFPKLSASKDGSLIAFASVWGGDIRRDVIVVRATTTDPTAPVSAGNGPREYSIVRLV